VTKDRFALRFATSLKKIGPTRCAGLEASASSFDLARGAPIRTWIGSAAEADVCHRVLSARRRKTVRSLEQRAGSCSRARTKHCDSSLRAESVTRPRCAKSSVQHTALEKKRSCNGGFETE